MTGRTDRSYRHLMLSRDGRVLTITLNRPELLKGGWKGYHSIRINDQWRLVFRWEQGHAQDVTVVDYH